MRRSVSVTLVAAVLLVLGIGAVSASTAAPDPAPDPAPTTAGTGRERVGTVEPVRAALGYQDPADRSVTFHYPGAAYVKLHLRRLLLLPGDHLTVSDPDGTEVYRYGSGGLLDLGGQWATSVTGDTAVVTLHRSAPDPFGVRAELARLGVVIDRVARGWMPGERPAPHVPESLCGTDDSRDAVCYRSSHPSVYRHTKPVARLLINGIELCTAFRVGPGNRLLTNHHCLADSWDARRSEVWFNYQCASCGGWAVYRPTKVRGERVLATDPVLDFTLFTVRNFAAVEKFGYLTLDPHPTRTDQELYIPQHPAGQPTRVALGANCAVVNPQAHGYGWYTDVSYYCDTQGGSSGSPVLSRDSHRVVALHHLGGCPNSGVRMDLIRSRIAPLLPSRTP